MRFFDMLKKRYHVNKGQKDIEIIDVEEPIIPKTVRFEDFIKNDMNENFIRENELMNQFDIAEYIDSVEYTDLASAAEMGWVIEDKPKISFKFSQFYFVNYNTKYEKDMTHEFFHAKLLIETYKKHGKSCCEKLYEITLCQYNGIWDKVAYYAIAEFYAYYKNAIEFHDIEIAEDMDGIISNFHYIFNSKNNAYIKDLFYKIAAVAAIDKAKGKINYSQKEPKIIDLVIKTKELLYKQYLTQEENGPFDYNDYVKFGNELETIFKDAIG